MQWNILFYLEENVKAGAFEWVGNSPGPSLVFASRIAPDSFSISYGSSHPNTRCSAIDVLLKNES